MSVVHFIHAMMNNVFVLGLIGFLLIMVPIVGIMIVNDPD
jgi:hypothetical protein